MVDQYEEHFLDQEQLRIDLKTWSEKYGFHFRHEDALYECSFGKNSPEARVAAQCGQIVLDYELREELIRRAEKNLLARAEELFSDLCNCKEQNEHSS